MASPSSSSSSFVIPQSTYDVFLSFRGEDTRNNFTSHLYAALCQKKIETFIDYDGLERGDVISPALLKAIEKSRISIVIFSEYYASSKWCLDELVKILECKEVNGQMVIPIFYQVVPSDVRNQTGSFQDAFIKHEERFKEMTGKVQKWRDALTKAANLCGWDSTQTWPEHKLVDEIVGDILKKLKTTSAPSDCEGLVGIDSKVEHIKSLMCIGSSDFRAVGIWGMGGIGKTTLAEAVFNKIRGQFEACCFIGNVREESNGTYAGLVRLKEQFLSKILGDLNLNIGTLNAIPISLKRRVQRTKVLVVLDDVSNSEQLKILGGGIDCFCPGSRVIITTRDKQVLCSYKDANVYQVEELNYRQAFQLFSNYAFKQNCPLDNLVMLSDKIIGYAKGNPLALRVLGSSLSNKDKKVWESTLNILRENLDLEIQNSLRISYNLLDREKQNLFLDIACFFKGMNSDHAIRILNGCYSGAYAGLDALIDKSLMTISKSNKLDMHDLLQDIGRQIVEEEDLEDPSRRSRLWNHKDILLVLQKKIRTNKVKAIFLDMSKIGDIHLRSRFFENMENLKFLKFFKPWDFRNSTSTVHLPQGLKYLPNELRYIYWDGYPSKTLASKFSAENLVELHLPYSQLEKLWKEAKHTPKLRSIDLNHSWHLTEIPNLPFAPQLQNINLENCVRLVEVPSSIQCFHHLRVLKLRYCTRIRKFQSNIHFKSLKTLDLRHCINLTEFPNISGHVEALFLDETGIEEVPSSIKCLSKLRSLHLTNCKSLKSLPTSICKLKDLRFLGLSNCPKLEFFPDILEKMERLEYLLLDGTAIKDLPSSIGNLNGLKRLFLDACNQMRIPEELCSLSSLESLFLRGNSFERLPTRLKQLSNLKELYLSNCEKLQSIPEFPLSLIDLEANNCKQLQSLTVPERFCLEGTSIRELHLDYCNLLKLPEDLCSLSSLRLLFLRGNDFESLPTSLKQLSNLEELYLSNCEKLQSIPELPLSLEKLEANNCKQLQSLTVPPSSLEELEGFCLDGTSIQELCLNYCNLSKLPEDLCSLSSLRYLSLRGNDFESLPRSLKQLSRLSYLDLSNCEKLESIPELPLSLKILVANNCKQLQSLTMPAEEFDASYRYHEGSIKFSFINCTKLNLLSVDPHLIQHYCYGKRSRISLCLPGSEIPDWFSYRNPGSSTKIQLPQFWYNGSFIGFAVCAVIDKIYNAQFSNEYGPVSNLSCRYHFENYDAHSLTCEFYGEGNDFRLMSDHIIIMYDFGSMDFKGECTKALFEIKSEEITGEGLEVRRKDATNKLKYWGVSPQ